ncbi:hypothetical protein B0H19DRAFT_1256677 [Mycena capillaripes]|nr:hypothetical protein B0H19DRAFT_1256677 [Mycena capillaripes]
MDSDTLAMAYGHQFKQLWLFISLAVLCYDHLLTFGDEINFIWRRPKRLSFFLFVTLRYVSLLSNIGMMVLALGDVPLEMSPIVPRENRADYSPMYSAMLGLRIYAMYNFNKIVLLFLIAVGAITVLLAMWSITGDTWVLATQVSGCEYPVSKQSAIRMAGAWEAQFFCDANVFVLTVIRAYLQPFRMPGSILSHMMRDGALYFAVIALVNLGNILMYYLGNPWIAGSLSWFTTTLSVTMISRLMLHLHKVADVGILTDNHTVTSLHFKSRHFIRKDEESVIGEEE